MIDLHTHTTCSDGDYSPMELIRLAAKKGLKVMAITDHDTISAYDSGVIELAKSYDIRLIHGVEFSTIDEVSGQKIHVVGLNIDLENDNINLICRQLRESRLNTLERTNLKLQEVDIKLRTADIMARTPIATKSHISRDVVSNPENSAVLIDVYGFIPKYKTFIGDYLIKGKPSYVKNEKDLATHLAVDAIKRADGKAICAHPSLNVLNGFDELAMHQLIIRNKFDGVEIINIQYDQKRKIRFDMTSDFMKFATENQLLVSGGSDFHGDNKLVHGEHSDLGLLNEPYSISVRQLELIIG